MLAITGNADASVPAQVCLWVGVRFRVFFGGYRTEQLKLHSIRAVDRASRTALSLHDIGHRAGSVPRCSPRSS